MRLGDSAVLDLIYKIRSLWFSWDSTSAELKMSESNSSSNMSCCESGHLLRYHCLDYGRDSCEKCIGLGSESAAVPSGSDEVDGRVRIKCCRFCEGRKKYCEKVHPRDSPEPPSQCFSNSPMSSESVQSDSLASSLEAQERVFSPNMADSGTHPSLVSLRCSTTRYRRDEEETEESGKHFFSPSSDSCPDISDIIDTRSFRYRKEFYSFMSGDSTPFDSPSSRLTTFSRRGHFVQREQEEESSPVSCEALAVLKKPGPPDDAENTVYYCSDDLSDFQSRYHGDFQKPLDFENNELIWFPPPPHDEEDEMEGNFFEYDDDEDDVGDSGAMFTSSSSLSCLFSAKERQHEGSKEPLRALVQVHFRALVSQLLYGEDIMMDAEDGSADWVDIVTAVAWQAASYVKPDTSRGGSMDPCDYVKIKCVASGSPNESTLVKGVVCTKNIKHKRMTSQYKNPRILILGGALEYQRVPNQLASFDTLLQQENDHLKMIISKIEALHPNVLLVEKSVSSCAQGYLLEKEISLVLNVKRPLLERISRCTGAPITPSIDNISTTRLGHCELFRLERVSEEHEVNNQSNRKPSKTLMFFEGCPRCLGCTVLLRGACCEELKKVKHVVQYAVFAAYHLSLETSFLADEGASLPKMGPRPASMALPVKSASDIGVLNASSAPPGQWNYETVMDVNDQEEEEASADEDTQLDVPSNSDLNHSPFSPQKDVGSLETTVFDAAYDGDSSVLLPSSESQIVFHHPEFVKDAENEVSSEYFSAADTNQSILVSFSSRCVLKGTVCERSRLQRIKFYGCFDKPLGRYLRDDLFDQTCYRRSCKEPAEAHVLCYTHQQGNLTVNVKRIPSLKLPRANDGKIWMWHRCLKCAHVDGVPPAARRVVMSDAAWGLSFGKFLELSFSNHATANRVATCGHSLQRDCLRYYGFGSMVAFFRFSPIDILSVCLPPSILEFDGPVQQEWLRKEAAEEEDLPLPLPSSDTLDEPPNLSERIDSAWTGENVETSPSFRRRLMAPMRVHSFDSALRVRDRIKRGLLPSSSLHLSAIGSFHASGDYCNMVRSSSLLLPQKGRNDDILVAVYDDEPTSIISYALSSKEYEDWVLINSDKDFRVSFGDESSSPGGGGRVKFSVTCYFAKQFESLRWKCCPSAVDFVRSLSRCRRWSAQGGKSNVYFAKSMDGRFIIKQVTKTELDSFEDFAPEYFKYLNDSLSSGSPTCLSKVLGLYQVVVKHVRGGRETKMDLMVMENLFYKRSISRVYDLKGSARARYNPDSSTGKDKVLLDLNLLEALRTKPIFLGSKAKRSLERAIWNDTSFLACMDVMDYSLLVGVDEERKELVVGIIDFMRQYTWDKHLETWVKASGILGGPKNASPTIVSPKQYKKRFRKAMTTYFLTVPDQWSSSS